ncbi:MAG TPA: hypothetical protein VK541_21015 [Pedobacter sp.]|uniref:hypothetical protein n=1 Tax=Pedobacter sp. TaxID=1411316 RepID=UPI002C36AF3A|nr:hypothetical protein [Pedobacter sp.]HMI04980.1 hypothetical protein [Pedobacter sp.]
MNKHFTILIICIAFTLSGCKKDKPKTPDEQEVPVKLLSKVTEISNGVTNISTYTYDDKNRIINIKKGNTQENKYSYKGEEIAAIELRNDNISNNSVFTYSGGKPVKITRKSYNSGTLQKESTYSFAYSGELITDINISENGIIAQKRRIKYKDNNIIETESESNVIIKVVNTYGNKFSRFKDSRQKYYTGVEFFDSFSVNDLLKTVIIYPDGATLTSTYTYTYDSDGYPITLSVTHLHSAAGAVGESKSTFEYRK